MKNRYDHALKLGNQLILSMCSGNYTPRTILAYEIKKKSKNKSKLLDLGCGEGDSAIAILQKNPNVQLDALDVSQDMLKIAKKNLSAYKNQMQFICEDGFMYLSKQKKAYDIITASWVMHNFKQIDKARLMNAIYDALNDKGFFMMMDKVYPDNKKRSRQLYDVQNVRYGYLPKTTCKAILAHEVQDFSDMYRMDESKTLQLLKKAGFRKVRIVDRLEKDVVLVAEK
jgi:ubiquinone/menaquinone biosynthesis C-methylase UbiE